jgi:ketosteroid isomerase-like protein
MTIIRRNILLALTLPLIGGCSAIPQVDIEAETELVRRAIDDCIKWPFPEKDINRLYGCLAKDSAFFIFHPDAASTMDGYDAFDNMIKTAFASDDFQSARIETSDMTINLSRSGTVAWFHSLLRDEGEWQGKEYAVANTRWTGVLEKREGRWLIVQMHLSFASDAP